MGSARLRIGDCAGNLHATHGGEQCVVKSQHRHIYGLPGGRFVVAVEVAQLIPERLVRFAHAHGGKVRHGIAEHRKFEVIQPGEPAALEQELA